MRNRLILLVLISLFTASAAYATPTTFIAEGVMLDGSQLSGSIVIDTTTGNALSVDLYMGPPHSLAFDDLEVQYNVTAAIDITVLQTGIGNGPGLPDLNVGIPVASLVGYTGGALCGVSSGGCGAATTLFFGPDDIVLLDSGSLSVIPEPSAAALFFLGSMVVAGRLRRTPL